LSKKETIDNVFGAGENKTVIVFSHHY